MNKKLVAFLLSTGILVSTCGTVFANEVIDPETSNCPPINTEAPSVEDNMTNVLPEGTQVGTQVGTQGVTGNNNEGVISTEAPSVNKADEKFDEMVEQLPEEVKEEVKDVELPPFPVSGDMQKEIDQLLKDYRAEYEKLLSNISTVKNTETSRQSGRLKDKYNEQVIDIHEKYYNIFDKNSDILGDLYLKCDLKYENYKAEMDKYDKYLREIDNIEEEALDDLDRIDEEYRDKIDKAYEVLSNKTTNTTSTVSESGSKMGSSSGSSTSYSSTGTENPKTGDYTTLGASIATMIAGIAGIFVSRKR